MLLLLAARSQGRREAAAQKVYLRLPIRKDPQCGEPSQAEGPLISLLGSVAVEACLCEQAGLSLFHGPLWLDRGWEPPVSMVAVMPGWGLSVGLC